ncbi:MAG: UDP-N-acetylmuramoyl-tripeptide--D-alanyl-D-alanine ligase [Erysipelotrichaceae bacterium]|nr:UDP-N-acetylmuramoyl-tripeptide--D-alanyl-D-alanine ligase [Erysipelotrichaceae bacterium]
MTTLLRCVVAVCAAALSVLPTKHALHMFQQNRYELQRYTDWLKNRISTSIFKYVKEFFALLVLLIAIVIYNVWVSLAVLLVLGFLILSVSIQNEKKKQSIKPLNLTWRVRRQLAVIVILDVILYLPLIIWLPLEVMTVMVMIAHAGAWLMIYPMALITEPIENKIKDKFMNMAKELLRSCPAKIVGITGSFGKTSSKNILQEILSEKYYSLMTPASFNTPMGITITVREHLKPIHEVFICEMGADHVGDIQQLSDFVRPEIGIVTSIGPQHLNTFGSLQNIIDEKMKLIENLPPHGVGILNLDNEYIRTYQMKNTVRTVTYAIEQENADLRAVNIEYSSTGSTFDLLQKDGTLTPFKTKLLGVHNIANILAAIAVGLEMGISMEQLQRAVGKVNYVEHRLEVKKINGYTFIDDAFNSNPVGSSMALEVLKMMPGRRWIVTPGMIDLGEKQAELNKQFGMKMQGRADEVILVGINQTKPILAGLKEAGFDQNHVHVVKTVKEAFAIVYQNASVQDTILLENDLPDAFNQ